MEDASATASDGAVETLALATELARASLLVAVGGASPIFLFGDYGIVPYYGMG